MYDISCASVTIADKHRMHITLGVGQGSYTPRAAEADRLSVPRKIKLTGAVEGEGVFDGSSDVLIYTIGELERDYRSVKNKPKINGVELSGDMVPGDLGLQSAGEYADSPITYHDIDEIIDADDVNEIPG